jgi:uncharacterized membrane protein YphA (DoxX/SURF4 family)
MNRWLRGLQWCFCAFIAWASVGTLLDAWPERDLHAILLSGFELIAVVAFLFDRLAMPACAVLCMVFAVAAIITALAGHVPLRFLYFAATAIYIVVARRDIDGKPVAGMRA